MTELRTYTLAELQHAPSRPRVRRDQVVRVEARQRRIRGEPGYVVTSPCCGMATSVTAWAVEHMRRADGWFECGKPWWHVRGNPRRGGCRARYRVQVVRGADGQPAAFDVTWTGQ